MSDKVGAVLVVGGGIAGMQSALDIRELGFKIYLVESNSEMFGNIVHNCCRATDNCNECSICHARERMFELLSYPEIAIMRNTTVTDVSGNPGNFRVKLEQQVEANDRDCHVCNGFHPYVGVLSDEKRELSIDVGAIIIATGFEPFDARQKIAYGYGQYRNVITAMDLEKMIRDRDTIAMAEGANPPEKIAFIQCVGSRDTKEGATYCSSVCCTYGIKNANMVRHHLPKASISIFFMDMRTYEKGAESYYAQATKDSGIRFIRSRIAAIEEIEDEHRLMINYETEDGELQQETFDLVVLSVGIRPSEDMQELAKILDVELDEYGFCKSEELRPTHTSCPGVFVIGTACGPKDIPETVTESSCVAVEVAELLSGARETEPVDEQHIEHEVEAVEPRTGVFVCRCGTEISDYIDVTKLVQYAKTLPSVVYAEDNMYTCSKDVRQQIIEKIRKNNINRVLIAACSHKTHEPLFQEMISKAGLNPRLFEMANIRDQCSWVHMKEPEKATEKAMDLIRIATAKARLLEPLPMISLNVIQKGLVIGGGLAGMVSASAIAEQGYEVYLVEKEDVLGGNLRNIYHTLENEDIQDYLNSIVKKVEDNPCIKVYKNAQVENIEGYVGNYVTTVNNGSVKTELEHGIIIVATGAKESRPKEYLYSEDERVILQQELEKQLVTGKDFNKKTIVMIQCVGSRDDEHPYCSRVCCIDAIKNALKLKEKNPDAEIFILYRDMRTYGFKEAFYDKARENGIIFVRYDTDQKPQIKKGKEGLEVVIQDRILNEKLLINADIVVLSPAIVPREENSELAKQLKVPLNEDGFFKEAHVRLRPVDFATEGVFLAGMAHSPKTISESISQAYAAASRACAIISHKILQKDPIISFVVDENCDGCAYCIDPCSFNAVTLLEYMREGQIKKTVEVNEAICEGCGVCMATCPKLGVYTKGFTYDQIMTQAKTAVETTGEAAPSEPEFEPRIVAFCCNWGSYTGADFAEVSRFQYPPNVRIIRVLCSGMVHPNFVMETLTSGADGVLMCGCHPGGCHYIEGNLKTEKRAEAIELLLEDFGLEPERFRLDWVSASEGKKFAEVVKEMVEQLKALGPSPYRT